MHVVEEPGGRPRRAVRGKDATNAAKTTTKPTMVKLAAPKAVGLSKPPQILEKVRGIGFVYQLSFISYACKSSGPNKCICTCPRTYE